MSSQLDEAPVARTLFRSPTKSAAGVAMAPPSSEARELRAQAISARQAVDLAPKARLRRVLGDVLLEVERAGDAGLDPAGFDAARTALGAVGAAAGKGAYTSDQRDAVARARTCPTALPTR